MKERVEKNPNVADAKRYFNYPYTAIEEALANAVYHKGYDVRDPIEVRVLPDRIEIVSHPGADRSISIDGLKNYRVFNRRYRNRRIGDFVKEMHLTEGRNTGFGKILRALLKNGSPQPLFETDDERTYFATTIYIHPGFATDGVVKDVVKNVANLSETETAVLQFLMDNPEITAKEISEKMGVVSRTVQRHLNSLKKKGYIVREGSNTKGKWIVLRNSEAK